MLPKVPQNSLFNEEILYSKNLPRLPSHILFTKTSTFLNFFLIFFNTSITLSGELKSTSYQNKFFLSLFGNVFL